MGSVFGSILDPAADKALMTTLTIALAMRGLLPGQWRLVCLDRCLTAYDSPASPLDPGKRCRTLDISVLFPLYIPT